jgi:hypothetical protein
MSGKYSPTIIPSSRDSSMPTDVALPDSSIPVMSELPAAIDPYVDTTTLESGGEERLLGLSRCWAGMG